MASANQFLGSAIALNGENLDTGFCTISTYFDATSSREVTWPAKLFDLLIQQLP